MSVDETGLTEEQLAALEEQLHGRMAELRAEVQEGRADSELERSRRTSREVLDRGDESSTEQWRETTAAMIGHHEVEMRAIKAALGRIASGTYGLCVECGGPIGFARLRAYPAAGRCVNCQASHERH